MTTSYIVSIESPDGSVATHEGVSLERVGQLLAVYSFGYIVSVKEIPAHRSPIVAAGYRAPCDPSGCLAGVIVGADMYDGPRNGNPG